MAEATTPMATTRQKSLAVEKAAGKYMALNSLTRGQVTCLAKSQPGQQSVFGARRSRRPSWQ